MKSHACLALLASVLLSACEPASLPPPSVLAVEPAAVDSGKSVELRLRIDAVLPGTMDYGSRSVVSGELDSAVQVWLGETRVPIQRYEEGGILVVLVPSDMAVGEYDVRLVLSDGREARRLRALAVRGTCATNTAQPCTDLREPTDGGTTPGPDAGTELRDGGAEGDGGGIGDDRDCDDERYGLSGFTFDTIEQQVRNVPFTITLRAEGSQAATYRGTVSLTSSKGTITPATAGPFVDGVLKVEVTLSQPSPQYITATDEHCNTGTSNTFMVRPN